LVKRLFTKKRKLTNERLYREKKRQREKPKISQTYKKEGGGNALQKKKNDLAAKKGGGGKDLTKVGGKESRIREKGQAEDAKGKKLGEGKIR